MWGPSAGPGQLEPSQAQTSAQALAALWSEQQQGVSNWPAGGPNALASPQHLPMTPAQHGEGSSPLAMGNWAPQNEQAPSHFAASAASKLYVQGLPQSLQHPVAVAGLFSPFGDVLDVKLYAAEVRLSGGSAVVRMRNAAQAAAGAAALNGVVPEGGWQQLTVRAAETAEQRSSRISAINGRQGGPGGPGSPLAAHGALPPAGPGGAALRRVHSARGAGSHGALHCYTGGLSAEALAGALPLHHQMQQQRRSLDWPAAMGGSSGSIDSSCRSSMDVARCGSAAAMGPHGMGNSTAGGSGSGGRSSSDSGSEELAGPAPSAAGGNGRGLAGDGAVPSAELQRMLLEAVLALLAQVESGQLTMSSMRVALESALSAAKQPAGGEDPSQASG